MRAAGVFMLLSVVGVASSPDAIGACCRNYQEFAETCRAQGGIPSPNPARCEAPPRRGNSNPGRDDGAARRAQAAAEAAAAAEHQAQEAQRQAEEAERQTQEAERQARFIRERDAAAGNLRGSIGTSVSANAPASTELRGSQVDTHIREIRTERVERDVSGKQAAWKQLHCAASILSPAILALKIDGVGVEADYSEFRYLADEALNALNGQRLGVSCAKAPEIPKASGRAADAGRLIESEKRLVAKVRDLGTKLEGARRKQNDAQATLSGAGAAPPTANGGAAGLIEQQRRINRARDSAGNQMAKAQREFNEGKRSEESTKKELKKVQEKVESVVRGERVTFDEDPPVASRESKK